MRKERGFTLIELAIVLVIIGIIIGMVLKGQDLIQNARMKRLANEVRKYEVPLWTCLDRLGRFPGDNNTDGLIDTNPISDTCFSNLSQSPTGNEVSIGGSKWYIYYGYGNNGTDPDRNLIAVCVVANCSEAFDNTELEYARAIDTAFDGVEDAGNGVIIAATGIDDPTVGTVTGIIEDVITHGSSWNASVKAIIYYFDQKP